MRTLVGAAEPDEPRPAMEWQPFPGALTAGCAPAASVWWTVNAAAPAAHWRTLDTIGAATQTLPYLRWPP